MEDKYQFFDGKKFTLDEKTGYYLCSSISSNKIRERMHRYVWMFFNGAIPKGYQVHHINGDRGNNVISNLQLLKMRAHQSLHGRKNDEKHHDVMVARMDYAREYASEWHGSKAGKLWHKEHYKRTKAVLREKKVMVCECCGKEFAAEYHGVNRFCSNKCNAAQRRKSGIDDITKRCMHCGKEFVSNKYAKRECCSRKCAGKLRWIRRNQKSSACRHQAGLQSGSTETP
jgi:hypothetical protein